MRNLWTVEMLAASTFFVTLSRFLISQFTEDFLILDPGSLRRSFLPISTFFSTLNKYYGVRIPDPESRMEEKNCLLCCRLQAAIAKKMFVLVFEIWQN